jgi:hypothetical protein
LTNKAIIQAPQGSAQINDRRSRRANPANFREGFAAVVKIDGDLGSAGRLRNLHARGFSAKRIFSFN